MARPGTPHLLVRRWRLIASGAVGATGLALALGRGLPPGLSSLIGWNAACVLFLATTLRMMLHDDEATVRARAAYEDEGQTVTSLIVLSAVAASLGAAVLALHESRIAGAHMAGPRRWAWVLSVSTLVLGWLVLQTSFTLRYAHRYFGDGDRDGAVDGGVQFPGDPPRTYRDFFYLSVCVGATAQVSDVDVTTARYRRLVTQHALVAFFYNTMVVALGINLIATVIGQ